MPDLDLIGAEVLGPEGLHPGRLSLADGLVVEDAVGRPVDLRGYRVLPGIVDLHGDGFERHLAPRRGAMKQVAEGLIAAEAELSANGITTGVLAQFISWEGGLRGLEFGDKVLSAIRDTAPDLVTDLRAQLRFETHLLELYGDLPQRIADWGLTYVVFNDHLPHDRLAEGRRPPRLVGQALKAGRNPDAHFAQMLALHGRSGDVPAALDRLCGVLAGQGVTMGSHDDRHPETRDEWHRRGVHVAEFPETVDAAEAARARGDAVVLGAPNVVRGGSHNGNASALDLIAMGFCDALASDYHYPSPRRAALLLEGSGLLDLAGAWALVSSGPARVLGLADRGELSPGKRADLVILEARTGRVAATMSGGRFGYLSGAVADRFMG
ncbi:alpha-D-ribose 1-methylphosphonate 5-triphosphate diphosphatase [Sulfitobacter sabulilitoris]|uniref:Alpha-D-ribose 1-methylphosphonate 5-triphosphate diphosphatase n=1 Tax=Sulfitobacter sabulilitoris TaxID=2562655 RepID=A0A5S3PM78_9RHOB|nr:alpha-D-ribose 1-methylphosphonate 5-triphosphate diphosphatase [Sulfitobacter sabulilitoris]TMM55451.1 alpha-D-ribose 1-methylphosphonate 5-triphosphate diphosphatase [Sulfitobacter sabulilitoris]